MIIRAIEEPFDMILEARNMLDKRIKTLLLFFGLNMVCLSVNYLKAEIDKADIIHSFIPQARTLKE
ncbi:hypothetical protein [Helicobacter pylori]|uniref:hypothetical protein n=2 Tax=Helicobacter pylori TaxID=210 RepID=UPI000D3C48FD|nr:hypothetical protein [Helicobacter pylori]PUD60708.1 hypothetical protein C2R58_02935 [Helicobacter pylori]WQZ92522.1 hypothetical protein KVK76_05575 [Helicobacter pylori]WQZ93956.1 hypothetical protein KVL67_05445 [Helicobacter pylori]